MVVQLLDILRIVLVCVAFYVGYAIGFADGYNPAAQLHFMVPIIILAVAGISGIEGLLFSKKSAEAKGYEVGSGYQRQSAVALLSYAAVAIAVYFFDWGIKAELTIFFAFIFFLIFSGINHLIAAVKYRNYKWQNINRPFITFLLVAGMVYPIVMALREL